MRACALMIRDWNLTGHWLRNWIFQSASTWDRRAGRTLRQRLGYRARNGSPLVLEDVLVRHPKLRVYIMHAGYPFADDLRALLFSHPQVYVDISSIVYTEPRPAFYRFLQEIVEAGYGDRVMFGSTR
jgi:predicted TIM-barrel fold metal-dependent hydrolase